MGADSLQRVVAVAEYLGRSLTDRQQQQLGRFHQWLVDEAIPAGGVGPHERDRLWDRHIADSLLFGLGLTKAQRCLDVGSGVGLPGLPLAICFPEIEFVLLDRSGRRCDLVRRASAILDLDNCVVRQGDVGEIRDRFGSVVSRAAIPPQQLMIHVKRLLKPGGVAILGLTRSSRGAWDVPEDPEMTVSVVTPPLEILDSPAYLLRIVAT